LGPSRDMTVPGDVLIEIARDLREKRVTDGN
jgi:hypothetical protein